MPPKKHVVFCMYLDRSEIFYMFYHELDLLLMAFVFSWEEGRMTIEELRQSWRKIACEEWGYGDYADMEWEDFEREGYFVNSEDLMNGRFCNRFWMDALDLEIAGVHYEEDSGIAAPPVFEIRGADTFKAVRDALADKYEIIVKENNSLYEPYSWMSPEEAKRFIEQARGG